MIINCLFCDEPFEAKTAEINRGNAKFCSIACGVKARPKYVKQPNCKCEICGNDYYVKACRVSTSKYCSKACHAKSKVTRAEYASVREAFRTLPNECYHCNTAQNLLLHHIDGNHLNNDPVNWRIVCRSCHVKVEHPEVLENLKH